MRADEALLRLHDVIEDDDKIVVDLGDNTIAVARAGLDTHGGTGALGGAMAIALGHCVKSDGTVYCVIGDGGFFMHLHTLATVAQNVEKFDNLVILVITDSSWGMTGGQPNPASKVSPADVAASMGLDSEVVEDPDDLPNAVSEVDPPAVIELRCEKIGFL
ncbi:MAG: hypothetical protein GXO28_01165 [Methanopyri archaeon]|nr:hypothetical protein [Methanopyri archaeon]